MAKLPLPQGGYDTRLQYTRIEVQPREVITIGDEPTDFTWHEIVPPSHAFSVRAVPDTSQTFTYKTTYVHKYVRSIWQSLRVEINDQLPRITDYGYYKVYMIALWTENLNESDVGGGGTQEEPERRGDV